MTIERGHGNLLLAEVDALVNTVNTAGVMGKGIALQFKKAYPDSFKSYERACKEGKVEVGRMHVVERLASPRFILNFPTKKHWRSPSRLEYIEAGLIDLVAQVRDRGIASVAIPPLGCGNGGLDWAQVRPLIMAAFDAIPDVRVLLFEPEGSPAPDAIVDRRHVPNMTASRAAIIALMGRYLATSYGYQLTLVEVQKLAYFLQEAGEPLNLDFKAHHYGPYADTLRKALRNIEGHYTRGLADGENRPETPLEILPGALATAEAEVAKTPASFARFERVAQLIDGFESPFGMELLGSVHWVASRSAVGADASAVVEGVRGWNTRKQSQMKEGHVLAALSRLREQNWVE